MNYIDVFIVIFLISSLFRGREVGFVRQLCSTMGFFAGLWLGVIVGPHLIHLAHSQAGRSLITLSVTLGCAFLLLTLGEYLGIVIKSKVYAHRINKVDNGLGSVLALFSMLIGVWLSASILESLPNPGLQSALKESAIVSTLTRKLPAAPNIIADLGHIIDPNGFPQVFTGNEPSPNANVPLPDLGSLQNAVVADRASVVKIEGQGCGGIVEGSGFIVGKNLVATNAHVVAGINSPYVFDSKGSHTATAVWFDPNLDFAILKVSDLTGKALAINTSVADRGTAAAVLGYPGGGNFNAKSAAILDNFTATGRNIYDQGDTKREIYEVKADIIPGNSGGPLVAVDGTVIGVVFAESTEYNHVGYALLASQITSPIRQAQSHQVVSTGNCAE